MANLRSDALAIWQAGVDAVRSDRLVRENLRVEGGWLEIGDAAQLELAGLRRIIVVGAGKAGAGMAAGVEAALSPRLAAEKQLTGWLNVPADCVRPLKYIKLHAARPAGVNEPTEAGAAGSREILRLVESLGPDDLCLCLISGGASALLPAPAEGISLADKLAVTRFLSAAGANIQELNTVRKQLSRIKGGGLLRACRAGYLATLIISDVIGDPLDVIGSGPTVEDRSTPTDALAVLEGFKARESGLVPITVFELLERGITHTALRTPHSTFLNLVIGNNAVAVDAAGTEAVRLGYSPAMQAARTLEGPAEEVGRHLADMALSMRRQSGPDCLISGGEPTVQLISADQRGMGGRNQQLVLAALAHLGDRTQGLAILSGGTDGEDGPTDAAGAIVDEAIAADARQRGLEAGEYLRRNDAYHFFEPVGGLIKTGPTHTNVCDLRVVLVDRA
jgi:hydroxypyruvate reductase